MRRREFLGVVCGAAAWPAVSRAQRAERMRRIGVLMSGAETDPQQAARWDGLRQGLEALGWSEGRDAHFEIRFAGGQARFEMLASEMVALQPDVIFVQSTGFVAEVARQTRTIPIVFVNVSDPIGAGFIATLARPGGNLTGLLLLESDIAGKWLSMLKEIAPQLKRVALVGNSKTGPYDYFMRATQLAAPALGLEVVPNSVDSAADLESSLERFARERDGGLVVVPDASMTRLRDRLINLAAVYRLPAIYPEPFYVTGGGLMSYGLADLIDQFRLAASYVDRILKGEKPADLPVQAPTRYSMTFNLRTAKALGLTVPPSLLVAADQLIE